MKQNTIEKIEFDDWDSINWQKITQIVFSTQKEIWDASINNEKKLLRKIQTEAFNSWSFKLLAVKYVTNKKFIQTIAGVKYRTYIPNQYKIELAKKLIIEKKSFNLSNVDVNQYNLPLIIQDSALQLLVKLILEPEWTAKMEDYIYNDKLASQGNINDLVYNLCLLINSKKKYRYVVHGYISKIDTKINLDYFNNTHGYSGNVSKQLNSWINADCFTPNQLFTKQFPKQKKSIIGDLIFDILIHGLEWDLYRKYNLEYKCSLITKTVENCFPFKITRISDQIILLVDDIQNLFKVTKTVNNFLAKANLGLTHDSIEMASLEKGFDFLGFYIRQYRGYDKISILPSKSQMENHLRKLRGVIYHEYEGKVRATTNKSIDEVINEMNPIINDWCLYYKDFIHIEILRSLDWKISNTIYKWFKKKVKSVNTLAKWKRNCQVIFNGKQRIGTSFNSVLILHSDFKPCIYKQLPYGNCVYYECKNLSREQN
uniref:Putative maturase n=2 Tax=Porphyridium purpureum TaxID=35688 RepID=A0A0A7RS26_PORPP|nr:putative maturase [Porphyridium purpureum]